LRLKGSVSSRLIFQGKPSRTPGRVGLRRAKWGRRLVLATMVVARKDKKPRPDTAATFQRPDVSAIEPAA
jgi:hypothetical protein